MSPPFELAFGIGVAAEAPKDQWNRRRRVVGSLKCVRRLADADIRESAVREVVEHLNGGDEGEAIFRNAFVDRRVERSAPQHKLVGPCNLPRFNVARKPNHIGGNTVPVEPRENFRFRRSSWRL